MKPTDILINEHRIIEQVLNCLERMVERCTAQGRLEREPARDAVAFFRSFAECSHLAKEQAHLFPAMAELECPHGCDSAELMMRADVDAHVHLRGMDEVIDEASAGDTSGSIPTVTQLHADRALDEGRQRVLKESLQHDNAESRCGGSHEEFVALANRLADHFCVPRAHLIGD